MEAKEGAGAERIGRRKGSTHSGAAPEYSPSGWPGSAEAALVSGSLTPEEPHQKLRTE